MIGNNGIDGSIENVKFPINSKINVGYRLSADGKGYHVECSVPDMISSKVMYRGDVNTVKEGHTFNINDELQTIASRIEKSHENSRINIITRPLKGNGNFLLSSIAQQYVSKITNKFPETTNTLDEFVAKTNSDYILDFNFVKKTRSDLNSLYVKDGTNVYDQYKFVLLAKKEGEKPIKYVSIISESKEIDVRSDRTKAYREYLLEAGKLNNYLKKQFPNIVLNIYDKDNKRLKEIVTEREEPNQIITSKIYA